MTVTTITDNAKSSRCIVENANYLVAQAAANGDSVDHTLAIGQIPPGVKYSIMRLYLILDTSGIPAGAIISAAKLQLYCTTDASTTDFDLTVQNGQPTYPHDPIVVGDFDKTNYAGSGGTLNTAGLVVGAYNDIVLDATGRGWINKGGPTKLCIRSSQDISATPPVVNEWVVMGNPTIVGQEVKLEITWTPPTGCGPALRFPLKQVPEHMVPLG